MAKARRRGSGGRRPRVDGRGDGAGPGPGGREHWRSDGTPKTRFATQDGANRSSLQLRLDEGLDLDPYECSICGGWHLGSRRG